MWPRPLLTWAVVFATAVVLAEVAGCDNGSPTTEPSESPEPSSASPTLATCGQVPGSTGPAAPLVTVRITAPTTAAAGATIAVQAMADVHADGPRIITVPAASRLLLTSNGGIVAESEPVPGPAAIPLPLAAGASRPLQAVPDAITLVGCRQADGSPGTPLPAGTYDVVAVLGYGQDPLQNAAGGAAKAFTLVSPPSSLTVH
jgi:hypothetical protein